MNERIDMANQLDRAHWCGAFCCTEQELLDAVFVMATNDVALVGLYLATRQGRWPPPMAAAAAP